MNEKRPPLTDRELSGTSFDPDASLSEAQRAAEPGLVRPMVEDTEGKPVPGYKVNPVSRYFLRGPWEMAASITIGVGILMLMQPFFLWLYTYSFIVILTGTIGFIIVSHFPEGD